MRLAAVLAGLLLTSMALTLEPLGTFDDKDVDESSGIVASPQHPGVFWTHNDSGNAPEIYATLANGTVLTRKGIRLQGVKNNDWEDIASDGKSRLFIGDIGNNNSRRKDLVVHIIEEPDPKGPQTVNLLGSLPFSYPDQTDFSPPDEKKFFDAEALFYADETLYILTKNRSGSPLTFLYRFGHIDPSRGAQVLEKVGEYNLKTFVTGADAAFGKLAILTYAGAFVTDLTPGDPLKQPLVPYYFFGGKCEAICFMDKGRMLITNEPGGIYQQTIKPAKSAKP